MRFLLLQIRDPADPMRANERAAFARAIGCSVDGIEVLDVLTEPIAPARLAGVDLVLVGGSGKYSACGEEPWLLRALEGLQWLYQSGKPMFASCWGFQALARALGGQVINDPSLAEVGTLPLRLTEAGRRDPVFGQLPDPFLAPVGHEDHVVELPPGAIHLAQSDRVLYQAYTFPDRPIYATQFHAELCKADLLARVRQYPEYLEHVTGLTYEVFACQICETPECGALIPRMIRLLQQGRLRI